MTVIEGRRKETDEMDGQTDEVTGGKVVGFTRVYFRCNEWNLNGRSLVYDPSFSD